MNKIEEKFKDVSSFYEDDSLFSEKHPYKVWTKYYERPESICLHYSDTIEILVCEKISGQICIEGNTYDLNEYDVFVIPPGAIHSINIDANPGNIIVFQLSFSALEGIFMIQKIFESEGIVTKNLPHIHPEYRKLKEFIRELHADADSNPFNRIKCLSGICEVLSKNYNFSARKNKIYSKEIHTLVQWTREMFSKKISLAKAASIVGLDKNYFCRYFKSQTGVTYLDYVIQLRLDMARKQLTNGSTVTECAYNCGFENISYFIMKFKKFYGMTPLQFKKSINVQKD